MKRQMENENLDAYFMSDKQLMKMLVGLSEDTEDKLEIMKNRFEVKL